jgi:hypothetical protein
VTVRAVAVFVVWLAGWCLSVALLAAGCVSCLACLVLALVIGRRVEAEVFGCLFAMSATLLMVAWPDRPRPGWRR